MEFLTSLLWILITLTVFYISGVGLFAVFSWIFKLKVKENDLLSSYIILTISVNSFLLLLMNQLLGLGKKSIVLSISMTFILGILVLFRRLRAKDKLNVRSKKKQNVVLMALIFSSIFFVLTRMPTNDFSLSTIQLKYGSDATSYTQAAKWILSEEPIPTQTNHSSILEMKSSVLLGTDQRTLTFGVAALLSLFSPTSTEFAYSFVVAVLLCTLLLFGIEVHKSNFGRAITIFLMALSPFFELAYMGYLAKLVFAIYFVFLIIILLKLRDSTVSANSPFLLVCGVGLATSWNPQPFIAVCAALVISILFITTLNGIKLLVHKTVSSIRIALSLIENLLASTFLIIIIGVLSWGVTRNLNLNTRFSPAMTKEESWNYDFVERFTTLFGANWYGDPKFLPTKFLIPSFICCTFAFLGFLFLNFSLPKEVTTEKTLAIFYSSVLMLILATSLFNELVRVSIQLSGFPWLIFAVLSPTLIPRKKSTGEFSYEKRIISVLVVTSLIGASMPKLVIIAIPFYQFDDVAIYRYSQQNIKKINKCTNGHDLLIGSTFGPAEAEFLNLAFSHFGQRVELSQTAVEAIRNWYRDQSNRSSYFPGDLAQNSKFVLERENVANDVVVCRYGSLSVYYRT